MFINNAFLYGRSGVARLKFTTNIVLVALIALLLSVGVNAQENVLIIGTEAPVNLDPAVGSNDQEALFNRSVYDYLVYITPDAQIEPELASSWEISEDGLTYTFTLEEGVTFHDGSSFGPEDVVFTFERLQELESSVLANLGEFTVEAGEGNTVVFTLTSPNADFLYGVGARFSAILSSEDTAFDTGIDANGTGAFRVVDYIPGERAIFEANPDYWKEGQPSLAGVEHVYIDDKNAQVDALLSGDVHYIFKLSLDQVARIEESDVATVLETATNQHPVIRVHADEGALGEDVAVRNAFKLATDRQQLNDFLWEGRATIGNNDPIGPVFGAFYSELEQPGYDPAAACELIMEATGEERLSATLQLPDAFGGEYADMAALLQQQWAEGCIDVTLEVFPEGVYYSEGTWLDAPLGITGWGNRPIPQSYLVEAYVPGAAFNESRWEDEEMATLVEQAGQTADTEERAEIYAQISQIFAERGPVIVPYFAPMLGAVNNNVEGLVMNPFPGLTDVRTVTISQ